MKKTIFLILIGLTLLGYTSCKKTCDRQNYKDGKKMEGGILTIDRERGKKCSDYVIPQYNGMEMRCV